jgi:DNA primase
MSWRYTRSARGLAGSEVVITNPDKPFFPQAGHTKLHLVRYYAAVAEGALRGIAGRPIVLNAMSMGSRVSHSSRSGPPSSAPSGSRRWSYAFRRGGWRERSSCATRPSFCE